MQLSSDDKGVEEREVGGNNVKKISSDITEMKKSEMEREKENKELRKEVAEMMDFNKK